MKGVVESAALPKGAPGGCYARLRPKPVFEKYLKIDTVGYNNIHIIGYYKIQANMHINSIQYYYSRMP